MRKASIGTYGNFGNPSVLLERGRQLCTRVRQAAKIDLPPSQGDNPELGNATPSILGKRDLGPSGFPGWPVKHLAKILPEMKCLLDV
jgi:hypothetical protein